jgi:hypothetical protein
VSEEDEKKKEDEENIILENEIVELKNGKIS